MSIAMARIADRFFGTQFPGIISPDEPVFMTGPDKPQTDALQIAVVFGTGIQTAVLIDSDAAVFQISGQLQLLVILLDRQLPTQFSPCQISRIAGGFTGRISPYAVRPAEIEML